MDVTPILTELPIEEADRKILENLLKKADGQTPPLESLSETGAKVLFNLAINKVKLTIMAFSRKASRVRSAFYSCGPKIVR